jgi:predicted DCC family thiol-disulfide oxidoreductase YuxK
MDKPVILFDGECGFCSAWVRFVLRWDERERYLFAPLQSDAGRNLLTKFELPTHDLSTVVLVERGRAYTKSTAALRVLRSCGGLWALAYAFILVPRPIRDVVYDFVARRRNSWFGRSRECSLPSVEMHHRFLH